LRYPSAIPVQKDHIHSYHPNVIFLCETLLYSKCIDDNRLQIGFNCCFSVDANGRSDGLAMFWKHPFKCHLLNYSSNFINMEIHLLGKPVWQLAGYYGFVFLLVDNWPHYFL